MPFLIPGVVGGKSSPSLSLSPSDLLGEDSRSTEQQSRRLTALYTRQLKCRLFSESSSSSTTTNSSPWAEYRRAGRQVVGASRRRSNGPWWGAFPPPPSSPSLVPPLKSVIFPAGLFYRRAYLLLFLARLSSGSTSPMGNTSQEKEKAEETSPIENELLTGT